MANVIPYAFRGELFTGTHNFASGGDSFKLALYTANPYNTSSTAYNATNEVSASGTAYVYNWKYFRLVMQSLMEQQLHLVILQIPHGHRLLLQQPLEQSIMMINQINYVWC